MTRKPRLAFVVNGGPQSAMAERATAFATRLTEDFETQIVLRLGGKLGAAGRMLRELRGFAPDLCYVLDLASSGLVAAGLYKLATGVRFVVDTGDDVVALGKVIGRGPIAMTATRAMECYAMRTAAAVVVRGSFHRELLGRRGVKAEFVPDGVEVDQFAPKSTLPRDSSKPLVIGLVGNSVWIPSRQTCYGSELVELVRLAKGKLSRPIRGVLIGDGSGIEPLRQRCAANGIDDSIDFVGRIPYDDLPDWLRKFDICLSTQTNDVIGNVRTTGKLPLYLAAGRFVLASRVGEAARVLPPEMLVDFAGAVDPDYPRRLVERIDQLLKTGTDFSHRPECVEMAREHFEYDRLAARLRDYLLRICLQKNSRHVSSRSLSLPHADPSTSGSRDATGQVALS